VCEGDAVSIGDPLGGGGGLNLVRALAVGGQVVRAVFNKALKIKSSAANNDGLNGGNYLLAIIDGTGTDPLVIGTLQTVTFPAFGVLNSGEFGIDIQTDRPLVVGLTYSLTVAVRLTAFDGDSMGYPYTQSFVGAARPTRVRRPQKNRGIVDFASDENGITVVNGDIDVVTGVPSARLRCIRRATTIKNAFVYLPGYGIGFQPKTPLSINRVGSLKADLSQQLRREPDVSDAASNVTMDARGFVSVEIRAKTKQNQIFTFGISAQNS